MNHRRLTVCTLVACSLGVLLVGCDSSKSRGHELRKQGLGGFAPTVSESTTGNTPGSGATTPAATAAPVTDFYVDPRMSQGSAPLTVQFVDRSTGNPTTWAWDFGDGSTATTQSPTHTYTTPGNYTVSLQTTNVNGAGNTVTRPDAVIVGTAAQGSRFWYENDTYGQPFKTHDAARAAMAQEVLTLVNRERAAVGAPPLTYDLEAERAALGHSEDMDGRGYFDHVSPEGWLPVDRLNMMQIFGWTNNGENIAANQPTAAIVMQDWMNSPGHRTNILDPSYTHLGVGISNSQTPYWTQVFLTR